LRTKGIEIISAVLLGILIPMLLVFMLQDRGRQGENSVLFQDTKETESVVFDLIEVMRDDGTVEEMPIDQYVLSVVLSEMPADFEEEALKAQAVVARTYALRRAEKRSGKHVDAAVCTKSSCCQGYCSIEEYLNKGGKQSSVEKVRKAVELTSGLVLIYDGKLIDATYFSCSGGATEDAQTVWGTDIPYLKSVKSPGEEEAKHYVDTVRFTAAEFADKLDLQKKSIRIGEIKYTNGNGIEWIEISGEIFAGTELRKLLKLRSTAFYIAVLGDTVTITTKGFGHRVGMSQYGADAMAIAGSSFEQILAHYYQGTQLIRFDFH